MRLGAQTPEEIKSQLFALQRRGISNVLCCVFEAGRYEMWDNGALILLRATSVQNPGIFAQRSWLEARKGNGINGT